MQPRVFFVLIATVCPLIPGSSLTSLIVLLSLFFLSLVAPWRMQELIDAHADQIDGEDAL